MNCRLICLADVLNADPSPLLAGAATRSAMNPSYVTLPGIEGDEIQLL